MYEEIYDDADYKEDLEKEKRKRKTKIYRDILGISLMLVFVVVVSFYEQRYYYRMFYYIASIVYVVVISYFLLKRISKYRGLTDDLMLKDGDIIKYNSHQDKEKRRIPLEQVKNVYINIEELPRTLYVVYSKNGDIYAENFYKTRIKNEDKFFKAIEKRDLKREDSISYDELKEMIEEK